MNSQTNLTIKYSPKQTKAADELEKKKTFEVCYGGAKGGGKTFFGCAYVYQYCLDLIHRFNLPKSKEPPVAVFMGRQVGVNFVDTTLETWKAIIPSEDYKINKHEKEIVILDRVKIQYGGFDNESDINKFNSAEFGLVFIDQAEETKERDISILRAACRKKINGKEIPYKVLYTANPANCWLKREFIIPFKRGTLDKKRVFVEALPFDNPELPVGYIDILKDTFRNRPELLEAYLYGSWEALEGAYKIIKDSWIEDAFTSVVRREKPNKVLVADIARHGDDRTVIFYLEDCTPMFCKIFGNKSLTETSYIIADLQKIYNADIIVVDSIGYGAGVIDNLRDMNSKYFNNSWQIYELNSQERAMDGEKFANVRSEMWWYVANKFGDGNVSFPSDVVRELPEELSIPEYKIEGKRIYVEAKSDIKKRLGSSPDVADSYVMGVYAQQFIVRNYGRKGGHGAEGASGQYRRLKKKKKYLSHMAM